MMFNSNTKPGNITEKAFLALGTMNYIKILDAGKETVLEKVIARIAEIEDRMSAFKPYSDISKIKVIAGHGFRKVHADTFELIRKSILFGALSDGAFDITIRPLVDLWGIDRKGDFIPSDFEIRETLPLIDYQNIMLDEITQAVSLKIPGQSIDLCGIAKGFAADEARRILVERGIQSAMINLGGNIMVIGNRAFGQQWKIGVQNPLTPAGQYLGVLSVTDCTIVTSGSNERFFIKDGIRYHHLLDPRTGRPAAGSLLSVTVVCKSSSDADALSTALFVLGPEKGRLLLEKVRAEAIFVSEDLTVTVSQGLKDHFKLV